MTEWADAVVSTGLAYTPGQWLEMTREQRTALATATQRR